MNEIKEKVIGSRALPLLNRNRSKKSKQTKRDEGGRHMWLSLVAFMCSTWAPSHISHLSSYFEAE